MLNHQDFEVIIAVIRMVSSVEGKHCGGTQSSPWGTGRKYYNFYLTTLLINLTNLGPFLNAYNTLVKCYVYKTIKDTRIESMLKSIFFTKTSS